MNSLVKVVYIYSGTSKIRTSPKVGLFNIPNGDNSNGIDWLSFWRSSAIDRMRTTIGYLGISELDLIEIYKK